MASDPAESGHNHAISEGYAMSIPGEEKSEDPKKPPWYPPALKKPKLDGIVDEVVRPALEESGAKSILRETNSYRMTLPDRWPLRVTWQITDSDEVTLLFQVFERGSMPMGEPHGRGKLVVQKKFSLWATEEKIRTVVIEGMEEFKDEQKT